MTNDFQTLSLSLIICHVVQKPTLLLVAPMAVQTNSRIGMVRRNLASAHKQRRKVSLIEAIKVIKLRAICNKLYLQVALNC